jgi:hypothetical protein
VEHIVYVKLNKNNHIVAVNSSAFLTEIIGWVEIDRGYGDKYVHAQSNYFPEPIMTMGRAYQYRLDENNKPVKCTDEEIAEQEKTSTSSIPSPTLENRVETLETDSTEMKEALEMILSGVTE